MPIVGRSWAKKEANFSDEKGSVNRGCRDKSGVIGPLLTGAEMSDDTAIADDELGMIQSRFLTPFTPVYRCWKYTQKVSLCLTFRPARRDFLMANIGQEVVPCQADRA
jgi:hypothetical protein